jgi:hypothetical protein
VNRRDNVEAKAVEDPENIGPLEHFPHSGLQGLRARLQLRLHVPPQSATVAATAHVKAGNAEILCPRLPHDSAALVGDSALGTSPIRVNTGENESPGKTKRRGGDLTGNRDKSPLV